MNSIPIISNHLVLDNHHTVENPNSTRLTEKNATCRILNDKQDKAKVLILYADCLCVFPSAVCCETLSHNDHIYDFWDPDGHFEHADSKPKKSTLKIKFFEKRLLNLPEHFYIQLHRDHKYIPCNPPCEGVDGLT